MGAKPVAIRPVIRADNTGDTTRRQADVRRQEVRAIRGTHGQRTEHVPLACDLVDRSIQPAGEFLPARRSLYIQPVMQRQVQLGEVRHRLTVISFRLINAVKPEWPRTVERTAIEVRVCARQRALTDRPGTWHSAIVEVAGVVLRCFILTPLCASRPTDRTARQLNRHHAVEDQIYRQIGCGRFRMARIKEPANQGWVILCTRHIIRVFQAKLRLLGIGRGERVEPQTSILPRRARVLRAQRIRIKVCSTTGWAAEAIQSFLKTEPQIVSVFISKFLLIVRNGEIIIYASGWTEHAAQRPIQRCGDTPDLIVDAGGVGVPFTARSDRLALVGKRPQQHDRIAICQAIKWALVPAGPCGEVRHIWIRLRHKVLKCCPCGRRWALRCWQGWRVELIWDFHIRIGHFDMEIRILINLGIELAIDTEDVLIFNEVVIRRIAITTGRAARRPGRINAALGFAAFLCVVIQGSNRRTASCLWQVPRQVRQE